MPPRKKTRRKTTRRKSPTKRTRTKARKGTQIQIASHVMREIWAVVYMALCVLTILSINGGLGFVGEFWNNFLTPIFGWGLYAVPVLLGGISLALFFARRVEFDATRTLGIGLMVVSALGTLHLAVPSGEIYEVARAGEYGGYIGFVSSFISRQVLGVTGSYVVFLALFLISVLLTFSVSLREIMMLFEWKWERKNKKKEPKAFSKKSIVEEDEDDMIIHTMRAQAGDDEEVVFEFEDKGDSETLHLKKVEPSKGSEKEDPGQKIPVEKIAEQLEKAEAEAEEVDEE
ncbi:hypothetical protein HN748_05145, partial [Candidatus Peregrinibacteria bacterium]|nr:hypothetical protein [Candidatus Peregrinibacteria bacterium]